MKDEEEVWALRRVCPPSESLLEGSEEEEADGLGGPAKAPAGRFGDDE